VVILLKKKENVLLAVKKIAPQNKMNWVLLLIALSGVKKLKKVHVVSDYTTLACHPSSIKRYPDEVAEDSNEASFAEVGQVITGV